MANPEEVNFPKLDFLAWVIDTVPDAFKDRSEEGDACSNSNQYSDLGIEDIPSSAPTGPIDVDLGHVVAEFGGSNTRRARLIIDVDNGLDLRYRIAHRSSEET